MIQGHPRSKLMVIQTEIFKISTKNNRSQHLVELYGSGKFGESWWKTAICKAFNSFCVTHSLTDRHTN